VPKLKKLLPHDERASTRIHKAQRSKVLGAPGASVNTVIPLHSSDSPTPRLRERFTAANSAESERRAVEWVQKLPYPRR
jgi:hypothetical protein